jgi:hypothetical protein
MMGTRTSTVKVYGISENENPRISRGVQIADQLATGKPAWPVDPQFLD